MDKKDSKEYFKIKLQVVKDNLVHTNTVLGNLDGQLRQLDLVYEADKAKYEARIKHFQELQRADEARIKDIEKKISDGYSYIDMKTGKAYKTMKGYQKATRGRGAKVPPKDEKPPKRPKTRYGLLPEPEEPKESLDELLEKGD